MNLGETTARATTSVLIADDVAQIRRMVRRILERDGRFEVTAEAADGVEAVELAAKFQPEIVLLDLMMPRMSGVQALAEIRQVSPHTRVVIFSGYEGEMSKALGADAYLCKGVSAKELLASVGSLVGSQPTPGGT